MVRLLQEALLFGFGCVSRFDIGERLFCRLVALQEAWQLFLESRVQKAHVRQHRIWLCT